MGVRLIESAPPTPILFLCSKVRLESFRVKIEEWLRPFNTSCRFHPVISPLYI